MSNTVNNKDVEILEQFDSKTPFITENTRA